MYNLPDFMPHGFCYLWRKDILALHALSDSLIFIAYMLIPLAIQNFIAKRRDLSNILIFRLFQLFIIFCGLTHFLEVISIWLPIYFTTGLIKMATAIISLATVVYASRMLKRLGDVKDFNVLAIEDEHELSTILNEIVDGYMICDSSLNRIKYMHLSDKFKTILGPIPADAGTDLFKDKFDINGQDFINDNVYNVNEEFIKVTIVHRKSDQICIFKIVTEAKRLQDAHDQNEAMINLVLNKVPALISIVSKNLKYLLVNKPYESTWGKSVEQMIGHSIKEVLPPSLFENILPYINRALAGEAVNFETSLETENGPVTFNVSYLPYILHGKVEGFFTMVTDNTERSKQERILVEKNQELEALTKDLEEFIYFISHDLQAPIRHISSFTNLLLKDLEVPDERQKYVEIINSSCQRARELVEGILKVANLKKEKFIETPLDKLFYTFINTVKMENPLISFNFNVPSEKNVRCIPFQMSLVFENFVSNSIRALNNSNKELKYININYYETPSEHIIYVEDSGDGVSQDIQDKIFGIFKSYSKEKSTGVGLAIVERVAELHDSRYGFFNNNDGGASFWIAIKK